MSSVGRGTQYVPVLQGEFVTTGLAYFPEGYTGCGRWVHREADPAGPAQPEVQGLGAPSTREGTRSQQGWTATWTSPQMPRCPGRGAYAARGRRAPGAAVCWVSGGVRGVVSGSKQSRDLDRGWRDEWTDRGMERSAWCMQRKERPLEEESQLFFFTAFVRTQSIKDFYAECISTKLLPTNKEKRTQQKKGQEFWKVPLSPPTPLLGVEGGWCLHVLTKTVPQLHSQSPVDCNLCWKPHLCRQNLHKKCGKIFHVKRCSTSLIIVAVQLCPILCNLMDCSTPGFPVFPIFQSLLKLMSIESVMPSNHLIFCHPLLLLPSIFPSIRGFSSESTLRIHPNLSLEFFLAEEVLTNFLNGKLIHIYTHTHIYVNRYIYIYINLFIFFKLEYNCFAMLH